VNAVHFKILRWKERDEMKEGVGVPGEFNLIYFSQLKISFEFNK